MEKARSPESGPEVTVVVPYGGGHDRWLEETLASVPAGVPRIVARNENDLAGALNRAIAEAETEFVFRLDADDLLMPGALDLLLGPAWNADVVYPAMLLADEQLALGGLHDADPFCGYRLQDMNYVTGAALMRRTRVLDVGGYRELEALEDWDLWVRLHRAGARFKPCPQAQIIYRVRTDSRNARIRDDDAFRARLRRKIIGRRDPLANVKATFYAQATPATAYLRCQLPARHLPGLVYPHVTAAASADEVVFPEQRGAAVFQYPADKARALMTSLLRANGTRVLVEVDDNYLINPGREIRKASNWSMEIGDRANSRQGHRWITERADGVLVTTPLLADTYRRINPNVYICPNTVDPADWPEPVKPDDGIFRIAWIASKSHLVDIPLITRAFEWASRQPGVEVYVGGIDPRWNFEYGFLPWLDDLDAYRALFQTFDVGLAPIRRLPFALYRSDIKACEIAMGLAAPVLSDVPPYDGWQHGHTCLKATDPKGFLRAIQHLVTHPDEARQLAHAAREHVLAKRTTEAQIHLWEEAIAG